ncbi:hypothetical protein LTR78_001408 [Recurvomyces mirabilis]|uniref:C2 domain-containing protein n=1 Tax=Recurvomyces mirabilis TaxID=574656 RepID=A0AAE0WW29_9PEZI|nr:hypothetical protein LTR78_001408 [Recurvomyces mirabilis]KAK5161385.1 hypothetical protein LTS14_001181 [Recurvomyces mirabilis]
MASQAAPLQHGPHAAGIFADMTVDGPEIGTLVLVIDRAKNLPNRRSMGKQSAYCAARVGKEAKKTETDKRGGQTPKWDQELRFTIHDSPDYQQFKLSIFSEDKRTDLVGEAWVNLTEVVVPGGGKNDLWQGLNCKGKYAGEIRIELTYYDSRPKPEKSVSIRETGEDDLRSSIGGSRVKRRPLPGNPGAMSMTSITSETVADFGTALPGRAKHGPRDFRTPGRANSLPPEPAAPTAPLAISNGYGTPPSALPQQMPPVQYEEEPQQYHEEASYEDPYQQLDFLPQLPPSDRQRANVNSRNGSRQARPGQPSPLQQRPYSHMSLPHSHSAPIVPTQTRGPDMYEDNGYELSTDYPEPIPDLDYQHQQLRQRRNDVPPGWQEEYGDPYDDRPRTAESDGGAPPPPPPMHTHSAPAVPQYAPSSGQSSPAQPAYMNTPPSTRHHSVPNASPLQQVERRYGPQQQTPPHGHPARGRSIDTYAGSSPEQSPYVAVPLPPSGGSPYGRSPASRARHSIADPYTGTPTRPHPLSQEVPRPRSRSPMPYAPSSHARAPSPNPYAAQPRPRSPLPEYAGSHRAHSPLPYAQPQSHSPAYQSEYHSDRRGEGPPLIKPRAVSPRPPPQPTSQPRNSYHLQFPVRAFESGDNSPLSTSTPRNAAPLAQHHRITPTRKPTSSSQQPSPIDTSASGRPSPGGMPFSPDSFDVHNPNAPRSGGASPYTSARPESRDTQSANNSGPIVGWHGQEIDPSDHLPVEAWAPEPEKKVPSKTYGLGRDRDFGPRSAGGSPASPAGAGGRMMGKDNVITVRMKPANTGSPSLAPTQESSPSTGRNRLTKKNVRSNSAIEPLGERHNFNGQDMHDIPDPYSGGGGQAGAQYSNGFLNDGRAPAYGRGGAPNVPPKIPMGGGSPGGYGGGYDGGYGGGYDGGYGDNGDTGYGGNNGYARGGYDDDALAREIGSIDIDSPSPRGHGGAYGNGARFAGGSAGRSPGGGGGVPAPVAYVPVRSQRDRGSYY